ncbi:dolichol-phosphate mannosyltransferase subunit 3 [Exaiptasia diaphana]|uniref:Dolichol-phosphate mannosyltransferase subunit 3 n=1 Tax=Exaiptasia diaphana TaxID=2652724 RepID=A0A913XC12_EXADI|nr:dolichol-phosphate mannosyltransferase subunit 3 [Exaiptasia diaphana]KXJ13482.1 Dolichol-phosphate mannosyltransferase subunit 3 [Exaiptasia diaphana]
MTKLLQWLLFGFIAVTTWLSLLMGMVPFHVSHRLKEVIWPMPVYAIIVFGCYSLIVIGYRVATFNDCVEASESLKKEVEEARKDLTKKGFKFN